MQAVVGALGAYISPTAPLYLHHISPISYQAVVGALGAEASEAQAVVESQAAAWRDLDVQLDEERSALEARRGYEP